MSRRTRKINPERASKSLTYRLERGDRFHYVSWNGTVMPILAKNSVDACSLFNIWCGAERGFDPGFSDGQCGIVKITAEIPKQYCVFAGRSGGKPVVKHVAMP